jgi:tetratricopeptide (TPR) repeat protein
MSYWRSIGKTFWPVDLALIYPYHKHWPILLVVAATLLLVVLTVFFALCARWVPYLIVGWLWFLGTLVPTLGLVQVGSQAMADRYMYIPGIGLSIIIVWGANDLASLLLRSRKWLLAGPGIAALTGCLVCTAVQLRYWQNGEKLFTHVIEVTSDNYVAYECLGKIVGEAGNKDEALRLFQEAVRIEPGDPLAQYNLGTTLIYKGRPDDAIACFARAIQDDPRMAEAQNNWGKALLDQGKLKEATSHFAEAARLQPGNPEISYNLGTLLLKQSMNAEAIIRFADALRLKPEYTDALGNLKIAVMNLGGPDKATAGVAEEIKQKPDDPLLYFTSGLLSLEQNHAEEAEAQFARAARLKPDDAGFQYYLATALIQQHKSKEAVYHLEEALRLQPDNGEALNSLAWILASDPRPELRADKEAVRLAEKACQLTQNRQAAFVITLAAAYANVGRFSEAIANVQKARSLALTNGDDEVVSRAETLQKVFESRHTVADVLNSSPGQN